MTIYIQASAKKNFHKLSSFEKIQLFQFPMTSIHLFEMQKTVGNFIHLWAI